MNPQALPHLFQEELYRFSVPVAVILPRAWDSFTTEDHLLLKKILTSVKVDINAVCIMILPSVDLKALAAYKPERVLIFGADVSDEIPLYQDTAAQGFTVVRADDLAALDDQKKKNLWLALRKTFGV